MNIEEAFSLIRNDDIAGAASGPESNTKHGAASRWADLGCGDGLFTKALGRLLEKGSVIYAVDKARSLQPQIISGVEIEPMQLDFAAEELPFGSLDGILMANSLHYVKDQLSFIKRMDAHLLPGGRFLIVEYDTDRAVAQWVPYPLSFASLEKVFRAAGFGRVRKLGERPSVYGRANMYAALVDKE